MSYTIQQINNIGLKCGDTSLPFIQVIVDPSNFNISTRDEALNFLNEIYDGSRGYVAVGELLYTENAGDTALFQNIPLNVWNETGQQNVGGYVASQHQLKNSGQFGGIYYTRARWNGSLISCPSIPTSYVQNSKYYYSLSVIITTPDNKLYKIANTSDVSGIVIESNDSPGYTIRDNQVIVANVNGSWVRTTNFATANWSTTQYDITDYITGVIPGDPYEPGGDSDTGGGMGNFDGTGDNVDIPGLPSLSATDTGFITLFNPSAGELRSLANYMWSGAFDLNTFKKIFADPMDCILGLSIVPVSVPNGDSRTVKVGNISTGISMLTASQQYVEVDCGTLNVNEYWGAYLDYDPYTKAEIYLPYIGTHPIAVDDIMDKSVSVKYHVDILSGACTAFVKCDGSVLYEFIGQCSSSIPVSGNDWTNVINGVLTVAGAIGSMVATGGASAPMAVSTIASTAVNSMKPNVEKSGSMSGTGGMLAIQTPYLILTRPRQALPTNQNRFMGYPSFITRQLSNLSGYTEIESVHLDGIPATEQELSEIETLLKTGVIF